MTAFKPTMTPEEEAAWTARAGLPPAAGSGLVKRCPRCGLTQLRCLFRGRGYCPPCQRDYLREYHAERDQVKPEPPPLPAPPELVALLGPQLAGRINALTVIVGSCRLWRAATQHGYPVLRIGDRIVRVKVLVYEALHGPVGPRTWIRLSCEHSDCIAPAHLYAASRSAAYRDYRARGTVLAVTLARHRPVRTPDNRTLAAEAAVAAPPRPKPEPKPAPPKRIPAGPPCTADRGFAHRWSLDRPADGATRGVCRECGLERIWRQAAPAKWNASA